MKKKCMFWLLSMVLLISGLDAQTTFSVQGHPRPDLEDKMKISTAKKRTLRTAGDELDYSKFTLDSIKFWVGEGENRAALVVDWYDNKGSAMVWGFRWHKDSMATGEKMVRAVAAADPYFSALIMGGTTYGSVVGGFGYNLTKTGSLCLKYNNDANDLRCPNEDGLIFTSAYDFDNFNYLVDETNRWTSAWTKNGYWSYNLKGEGSGEFTYSSVGATTRQLNDGDWDGWGFCYYDSPNMGAVPRMPFVAALPPLTPFPEYEAYWPTVRKDTLSHMPIVNTPLAIEQDSLIEEWKFNLGGTYSSSGQPLIVNDNIYIAADGKIKIINRTDGTLIQEASLGGNLGFFSFMAYGEGKLFIPLANGILKAFRADNLEQIWQTEPLSGKQQLCEVTYHDGYVYTGMEVGSGNSTGTFYCVKAEDEDPYSSDEIKPRLWESFDKSYYWSGGTIVDNAIIFGGDLGALESRDRITGTLIDSIQTIGNIRCGTSYDKSTRRIFFTNKDEKKVYSIKVNADGSFDRTSLMSGKTNGSATTVPVLYNNRLYVSVGSMTSGGGLDVIDANTMQCIYSAPIGISQATPLISTGYANAENRNTIYIYVTTNTANGNIICLKDFEGNENPIIQYSYIPSVKQYSTHSLLCDENGTMYYKNDSGNLIAYTNKPTIGEDKPYIAINQHEIAMQEGAEYQLNAVAIPKDEPISWSSSDEATVTVDQAGKVSVLKEGKAYVFAKVESKNIADSCLFVSKYKMRIIASEGGKITSNKDSILNYGDDAVISISPKAGYLLTDVLVNGINKGEIYEYTFTDVRGDSTIEAKFELIPATSTPYFCNFEDADENENWISVHFTQFGEPDRWVIGNKTQNGGEKSLYLATPKGEYSYSTIYNFATAYRDITFSGDEEFMLTFDWICNGNSSDMMKIFLLDSGATVTGAIPGLAAQYQIGKSSYNGSTEWKQDTIFLDGTSLGGKTKRLAFQWSKVNISNNMPAPAIDNIALIPITAIEATNLSLNRKTDTLYVGVKEQLTTTILPANAIFEKLVWTSSNSEIATIDSTGLVKAIALGNVTMFVSNEAGTLKDSCAISVLEVDYTKGTFFVNEDWFGQSNGSVNFLTENGKFIYNAYTRENPGETFGATTQFGTIYGDNFYFVSKQAADGGDKIPGGGRLVVADAKTLKKKAGFAEFGEGGDGRSFLGVNESKGYIGTSGGIYVFNVDSLTIGKQIENTAGTNFYTGQIGTMLHIENHVFACKQSLGILVIDAITDEVIDTIECTNIGTIVQSLDGSLWATAESDGLWKINPYTFEIKEKIAIPENAQISSSWSSWTSSIICPSHKTNTLYWAKMGGSSNMSFFGKQVYKYDIENPDLSTPFYELTRVSENGKAEAFYGSAISIDPVNDQLIITTTQEGYGSNYSNNWVHFVDASTGELKEIKTLDNYYWFPAMSVFPDNYTPEISGELSSVIELAVNEETSIYLGDKVTDKDNFNPSIIKSISIQENGNIVETFINADVLHIKMIGEGVATIQLICNSNGKTITKEIKVGKEPQGITSIDKKSITVYPNPTTGTVYFAATIGEQVSLFDMTGKKISQMYADKELMEIDLQSFKAGIYFLRIADKMGKIVKQ